MRIVNFSFYLVKSSYFHRYIRKILFSHNSICATVEFLIIKITEFFKDLNIIYLNFYLLSILSIFSTQYHY